MKREFSKDLEERDRDFEIGGELFKYRELTWEDFKSLVKQEEEFANREKRTMDAGLDFVVDRIVFFLDPEKESHKRFKTLLKRKIDPVPHFQIQELHDYLWEEVSSRPTELLSSSSNGPGSSEASSQDK